MLTCSYFYDEEYLHGFRFLLQEIEAALKHRKVAALEAFGLRHTRADDAFRGYFRELNLFNPDVLEGGGFQRVQEKGEVARFRLDLAALIEAPRRSVAWEHVEAPAGAQPGLSAGRRRGPRGCRLAVQARQALLPVVRDDRLQRVVERHDAEQAALLVHDRDGEQVVLGHDAADLLFVDIGRDLDQVVLHERGHLVVRAPRARGHAG